MLTEHEIDAMCQIELAEEVRRFRRLEERAQPTADRPVVMTLACLDDYPHRDTVLDIAGLLRTLYGCDVTVTYTASAEPEPEQADLPPASAIPIAAWRPEVGRLIGARRGILQAPQGQGVAYHQA